LTSTNSGLQAYFAKPEAWNVLSAEEKATIRALLPETTPYNPDGSPSTDFLNHNTDWRNGIRQFQEDVQTGRMDPKWQADAAAAMEERAAGDFDEFKEQQYEAFWGQKQELPQHVLTGDASRVRLEELVHAGVFKVGDVWSYTRAFGRRKAALIEKEVTVRLSSLFCPYRASSSLTDSPTFRSDKSKTASSSSSSPPPNTNTCPPASK